ncbi:hypothetical protein CW736_07820 [Nonlabens sp. MB-3u-79]|uniref:hypothetical protein n=1 Tax=Nonlabens sp. MB-3u-79 TaxID=2058134 RepID=UPI000C303A99|nr:hypothetical protein [Nonlabens sp. MB-3u-79]AUC79297.1 hypothetical protein CW736_07820 [Nonlabens sp. MB-3u-79]
MKSILVIGLMFTVLISNAQTDLKLSKYRKQLEVTVNELSGDIDYVIPKGYNKQVQFRKTTSGTYYMCIEQSSSSIFTGTGVTLYFEDGSKIEKPKQKVDYRLNTRSNTFDHNAWLRLTDEEWEQVKTSNLKGIKMYVFDIIIKKPEKIRAHANIIREN